MQQIDLTPDCAACAALCCVLLPFDAGEAFGFDKAGGEPCRHLAGHACGIHAGLAAAGFGGCLRYDCLGAGQRVVQEVFSGQSWREDARLMAPMDAAFRAMRRLHEDHALLTSAARLPLLAAEEAERQRLLGLLNIGQIATQAGLAAFETGPLPRAVRDYLGGLKERLRPHR
jgi:hypothetical protein